jgi:hypothetical protein
MVGQIDVTGCGEDPQQTFSQLQVQVPLDFDLTSSEPPQVQVQVYSLGNFHFDSLPIMPGHHHHDHGDGGHCHAEHDHSNDITPAIQSLLYTQIDFDQINTLNGTPALGPVHNLSTISQGNEYLADKHLLRILSKGRSCHREENMGRTTQRYPRA